MERGDILVMRALDSIHGSLQRVRRLRSVTLQLFTGGSLPDQDIER